LSELNRKAESDALMNNAIEIATVTDLHGYGRQLLAQKKTQEAILIFEKNYTKYKGAWPTTAGLMRAYSATGDLKKALEYARKALVQAPNEENRKFIERAIDLLSQGKAL